MLTGKAVRTHTHVHQLSLSLDVVCGTPKQLHQRSPVIDHDYRHNNNDVKAWKIVRVTNCDIGMKWLTAVGKVEPNGLAWCTAATDPQCVTVWYLWSTKTRCVCTCVSYLPKILLLLIGRFCDISLAFGAGFILYAFIVDIYTSGT